MMVVDIVTLMAVLSVVFWRAASEDDDAQAIEREAGAEGDLPGVQDEAEVESGVKMAEVRQ